MSENYILLRNNRLCAEIAKPGTVYAGSRFDWTGFITQVCLDGKHTFCAYESITPGDGTGGIGFCNDFGLNTPVGYDDAAVGEGYMKIGIGTVLKQDDRPGDRAFVLDHVISDKADLSWKTEEDAVCFTAVNHPVNGYACTLQKEIRLMDNRMKISYSLKNTGEKKIVTEEYIHNFVCIDGKYVGPDYEAELNLYPEDEVKERAAKMQPEMVIEGNKIGFSRIFEGKAFYLKGYDVRPANPYNWKITEKTSGCSVSETDSFLPDYMAMWGTKYVISPEAFLNIDLEPGKELCWTREYTFTAE